MVVRAQAKGRYARGGGKSARERKDVPQLVQELPQGVPEMAEEDVPQLAPTALEGVAVDDDTAVHGLPELTEGVPEMAEEDVAELLE